uniref:Uncharacterized protein n=1 Tax=Myotis myotis TaxID=51298 RepID=A0A7J7Z423_MYOMY|nr:hypothetical protein mMyoMyo1_010423 [Myotis myotis]
MNRVSGFVCLGSSERTCPALISGACMRGKEQFRVQVAACSFCSVWSQGGVAICGMWSWREARDATVPALVHSPPPTQGRCLKVPLRNRHNPGSPTPEQWVLSAAPFRCMARHHGNHPIIESQSGPASDTLLPGSPPPPPRRMVCVAVAAVVKRRHLFVSKG